MGRDGYGGMRCEEGWLWWDEVWGGMAMVG